VISTSGHRNPGVCVLVPWPSEPAVSGRSATWDRPGDLARMTVPTSVICARHDTMDPDHMASMAGEFPNGEILHCPNRSPVAMTDDQAVSMEGLIRFIHRVEACGR
jgi:proline iminopeptidase